LLVCSIDKAEQIGLNWWRYDTNLTKRAERAEGENQELRARLAELEREVRRLTARGTVSTSARASVAASRKKGGPSKKGGPRSRK
jgi:hypothetical protein